ncbi:hypothetical protein D3C78_1887310 [compost metagenome]
MHGLVHRAHLRAGHGVGQHLRGAGVVLESELRIVAAGAAAPESKAALVDQRGDFVAVEVIGIGHRVLQIPEHVGVDAGDAIDGNVG